jgi:two-component system, response regulator FlrC
MTGGGIIVAHLPVRSAAKSAPAGIVSADSAATGSLANSLGQAERDLILDALRSGQGNRREAAERLGISPRTLRYKLARLREAGIDVPAA